MKLLLMPNLQKDGVISCVKEITKLNLDAEFLMVEAKKEYFPDFNITFGEFDKLIDDCDFCVAIGGDGTIIHTSKHAVLKNKPVIGINLGRLGFLSAIEPKEISLLRKLKTMDYLIEERMMLTVIHKSKNGERIYHALNDAVLSKGAIAKMVDLDISCNGKEVGAYRADGIVFSTPTGSTAYNLSAGGPIIDATIDSIALTPVAPHSAFGRTIIFNGESEITAKPLAENQEIYLTVDGEKGIPLEFGDEVRILKSKMSVKLINFTGKSFYQVLNDKLLNK